MSTPENSFRNHLSPVWDERQFAELEESAEGAADKFIRFCQQDSRVPYFTRYFHLEFPDLPDPFDAYTAKIESARDRAEKWNLSDEDAQRLLATKLAQPPEEYETWNSSELHIVQHGLFMERIARLIDDMPHAIFHGGVLNRAEGNEWLPVAEVGEVVLRGRMMLHPDPQTEEPRFYGVMYDAVNMHPEAQLSLFPAQSL